MVENSLTYGSEEFGCKVRYAFVNELLTISMVVALLSYPQCSSHL